jgi:hypothetical protein
MKIDEAWIANVPISPQTGGRRDHARDRCPCFDRSKDLFSGGSYLDFMHGVVLYASGSSIPSCIVETNGC